MADPNIVDHNETFIFPDYDDKQIETSEIGDVAKNS